MGWVSTSEDIEERRLEDEVRRGYDSLIERIREAKSVDELRRQQSDFEQLSSRLIEHFERKKTEALKAFHESTAIFREPHVRIMSRLRKKESELQEVRAKLRTSEQNLERCREKRSELQARLNAVELERNSLRQRVSQISGQLLWAQETRDVQPILPGRSRRG